MNIIKKTLMIIGLGLIQSGSFAQNWQLVWQDEFTTGIGPDWNFEVNGNGGGNNELQYYRQENASVQNGSLVITAKKENYLGKTYTSARMTTQNKKSWKYGKIEARIAAPSIQGIWPAFWMLGGNISTVGWPKCGEIDIFEHVNTGNTNYGTIHWNSDADTHVEYGGNTQVNDITQYHTYTVEWDANLIKWYVDGVKFHEANIAGGINSTSEFHNNFFIILNVAVGGNWPGNTIGTMPANMYIDYVRVYQDAGTVVNKVPTVSITSPTNNATFTSPASIVINADAADTDGNITKVDFYNNNTFLGSDATAPYTYTWNGVGAGTYSITAKAIDNANAVTTSAAITIKVNAPVPQGPFGGTSWPIPGVIQAENYDVGGQDVAYNDLTPTNQGNSTYRTDAVDIETCTDAANGIDVGYISAGEWLEYSVNVQKTDNYDISTRVATTDANKAFHIEMNGTNITGTIIVPTTGGWDTWQTVEVEKIALTAGNKIMRIVMETGDFNINYIEFTKSVISGIENSHATELNMHPNPTQGILNLDQNIQKVEVYTIDGRISGVYLPNTSNQIDISNLQAGLYILKLDNGAYSFYHKIIKE
jgi:beta-glucanase (GH16 family)